MKTFLHLVSFFSLSVILMGCPYSSPYALDDSPQLPINESYLGKWATMVTKVIDDRHQKIEPIKLIFAKKNDMEYDVAITGYIDELKRFKIVVDDTIKGTAFLSTVVNKQFLNLKITNRTYLAEIKDEDGGLSIYPMSDYFTNKMIKSSPALRNSLEFHYKTRLTPNYDEEFMLKDLKKVN